jgi:hypothetical protein
MKAKPGHPGAVIPEGDWHGPFAHEPDAIQDARRRIGREAVTLSEATVKQAWARSLSMCECRDPSHRHGQTGCFRQMIRDQQGQAKPGGWQARPIVPFDKGGRDELANCEIVCWSCYESADLKQGG